MYLKSLWQEMTDVTHTSMRKTITYSATLAIQQNEPHAAIEMLSLVPRQNYVTIRNLKDIMKYWLDIGVTGFHLDKVQHLLEDKELVNEIIVSGSANAGGYLGQYEFFSHYRTTDLPELADVLYQWNQIPTNSSGILSVNGVRPDSRSASNATVGQLLVKPQRLHPEFNARQLNDLVTLTLSESSWPTWEVYLDVYHPEERFNCFQHGILSF